MERFSGSPSHAALSRWVDGDRSTGPVRGREQGSLQGAGQAGDRTLSPGAGWGCEWQNSVHRCGILRTIPARVGLAGGFAAKNNIPIGEAIGARRSGQSLIEQPMNALGSGVGISLPASTASMAFLANGCFTAWGSSALSSKAPANRRTPFESNTYICGVAFASRALTNAFPSSRRMG